MPNPRWRITYTNHPFREEKTVVIAPTRPQKPSDMERVVATARERAKGTDGFDVDEWNYDKEEWVRIITRGKHVAP